MYLKARYNIFTSYWIKYRILIENFSYLSLVQIVSMVIPLITYPYLIRVLGSKIYGLVVFAQGLTSYLLILVNFGFNFSAIKDISVHRNNPTKLSEIVSSVLILKSILFILSTFILIATLSFISSAQGYKVLFILSMWVCMYEVIYPSWYFQGIENMKYITYINLVTRLIFLLLIFLLIHKPEDYLYLPLINCTGAILGGVISLYIIFYIHDVKFSFQPSFILKSYFKDSLSFFISNIAMRVYVSSNKVIIGSFIGLTEVAYYDLGDKIIELLKIPQSILNQTIFPKINNDKNVSFVKKIFKVSLILHLLLTVIMAIFSEKVVILFGGTTMIKSIGVVNILIWTVPIVLMSGILGLQVLIPFGYKQQFTWVISFSGIIYLLQLMIMAPFLQLTIYSISFITLSTEIFVTLSMYYYCKKYLLW